MSLISTSPILSDLRGRSGSNIFKTIAGNSVLRRDYAKKRGNLHWATWQKDNLRKVNSLWKIISDVATASWYTLADDLRNSNKSFWGKNLDAYNLFVSSNLNSLRWGLGSIVTAPAFASIDPPLIASVSDSLVWPAWYLYVNFADGASHGVELMLSEPVPFGRKSTNIYRYCYNTVVASGGSLPLDNYLRAFYFIPTDMKFSVTVKYRAYGSPLEPLTGIASLYNTFTHKFS